MRKWNYITFLIILVPRMQTQMENGTVARLLEEIDEFYGKLDCPEDVLLPIVVDINEIKRNPHPDLDFPTHINAYIRYQLLNTLLADPGIAKRCGSSNEQFPGSRTFGLFADIWRHKLCFALFLVNQCEEHSRPNYNEYNRYNEDNEDSEDSEDNEDYERRIHDSNTRHTTLTPSNTQPNAACTPFDQHVLLANGKLEKQRQLNCVFPNKTSIIVPMDVLDIYDKPPGQSSISPIPPASSHLPNIQINQDVKIDIDRKKPKN